MINQMTTQSVFHSDVVEDEPQKKCHKCGEFWPETDEFFPRLVTGKLNGTCRACIDDRRHELAETKTCCVPGCNQPRYYWRYARCWEHRRYLTINPHPRVYKRKVQP